jgi:hypothetical protein
MGELHLDRTLDRLALGPLSVSLLDGSQLVLAVRHRPVARGPAFLLGPLND